MLLSISQGARELGVSIEHARRQIRAGRWPFYKLGPKATRIDIDEIRKLYAMPDERKTRNPNRAIGGEHD